MKTKQLYANGQPITQNGYEISTIIPDDGLHTNIIYDFGTTDTVNIVLAEDYGTLSDYYIFRFTCETAACSVTLPSTVAIPVYTHMEIVENRRFECIIDKNNCLTFNCWD